MSIIAIPVFLIFDSLAHNRFHERRRDDYVCKTHQILAAVKRTEPGAPEMLDITGLTPRQTEHIRLLVDDLRNNEN